MDPRARDIDGSRGTQKMDPIRRLAWIFPLLLFAPPVAFISHDGYIFFDISPTNRRSSIQKLPLGLSRVGPSSRLTPRQHDYQANRLIKKIFSPRYLLQQLIPNNRGGVTFDD